MKVLYSITTSKDNGNVLTNHGGIDTLRPSARNVGAVLLEVPAHKRVQPIVAGRVLHESGLVAETVAAVFAHAVEVGLVFAVAAVWVLTVFVEPFGVRRSKY